MGSLVCVKLINSKWAHGYVLSLLTQNYLFFLERYLFFVFGYSDINIDAEQLPADSAVVKFINTVKNFKFKDNLPFTDFIQVHKSLFQSFFVFVNFIFSIYFPWTGCE